MKTVQRHVTWKEGIWALIRVLYYFLGVPSLLVLAFASLFAITSDIRRPSSALYGHLDGDMYLFFALIWAALIIPLGFRRFFIARRRRHLKWIVDRLTSEQRFKPQKQHQVLNAATGQYLAIDNKRGTILYIHMVKKGITDVMGLTMDDWTDRELEGNYFRIYTRNPDVPVLSVHVHPMMAKELFDTLGAMSHNHYPEPVPQEPWATFVGNQCRAVERQHNVVVPQAV